ncbi:chemotaxis protein CheX [Alkalicella caledoniensis]|uniref:Chemotaxis protein CheX n=1 Tax=Alkalicella caledoniensis TaxID=2731377 RepID=A0A7G9W5X1_ALKCA|nr:chemotaxis protein CheX [Alkalicella caledoniensis]QNO14083.1 chemotaxis protein CheX [Alkalicella caledoniensis]
MKAEYINPFFLATKEVLQMMLDVETERGQLEVLDGMIANKDVNVLLGVTGDLKGSILFSFPEKMTLEMVRIMAGMEMEQVDAFVSSALGEVANIISGNAMTKLTSSNYVCDIVPPQIFVGENKSFSMASQKSLLLPLKTPIGDFDVTIFLKGV